MFSCWGAGIAEFKGVSVQYLGEFVMFWEMLCYQGEELFSDVGCYCRVVWGVEPNNFSGSIFLLLWCFGEPEIVIETTVH